MKFLVQIILSFLTLKAEASGEVVFRNCSGPDVRARVLLSTQGSFRIEAFVKEQRFFFSRCKVSLISTSYINQILCNSEFTNESATLFGRDGVLNSLNISLANRLETPISICF